MAAKQTAASVHKGLKELGWNYIETGVKDGFNGAVKDYPGTGNGGRTALVFVDDEAYMVVEDNSPYTAAELEHSIVRPKEIKHKKPGLLVDTVSVVTYDAESDTVGFDEEVLERYGINTPETREDIENRLRAIVQATVEEFYRPS